MDDTQSYISRGTIKKAWTEIATPSLEVLGNLGTQMHNETAHADGAQPICRRSYLKIEKFLSSQRER